MIDGGGELLSEPKKSLKKLLQGFLGDMMAGFFVLCHFLDKIQPRQIRDLHCDDMMFHAIQNPSSNFSI